MVGKLHDQKAVASTSMSGALSLATGVWTLAATLLGSDVVPGWASTVIPIYFLGGIQLLALGVIGEYLAKTYLEVKQRPRYLIEKRVG